MKRYLAAGVLLLAWGSGYGAQWHTVQTAPERTVYVDLAGRVRAGNAVQTWDWQKYAEEQKSAAGQGAFHWVKSLASYDCLRRSTSPVLRIYFRNDGSEVRRGFEGDRAELGRGERLDDGVALGSGQADGDRRATHVFLRFSGCSRGRWR